MDSKKFEKLAEKISKKDKNNVWKDELGFVGTEAVFYTNKVTLISNYYEEEKVEVRNPLTLEPVGDQERAKAKYWRRCLKYVIDDASFATVHIPNLFYKVAKAFKNPLLVPSSRSKTGAIYEVLFFNDKIIVNSEHETLLTFAEDYGVEGDIKEPVKFNLFFLMQYKPMKVDLVAWVTSVVMRVIISHDRDITNFEACLISSMRNN